MADAPIAVAAFVLATVGVGLLVVRKRRVALGCPFRARARWPTDVWIVDDRIYSRVRES